MEIRSPSPAGEAAKDAAHAAEIARLRIENAGLRQQLSQARPSAEVQDLLREIVTLKGQLAQASPHPGSKAAVAAGLPDVGFPPTAAE